MGYVEISSVKTSEIIGYVDRAADLVTDAKKELELLKANEASKEVFDKLSDAYDILHGVSNNTTLGKTKLTRVISENEIADRIEIDETVFSIYSKLKSLEEQVSEYNKKYGVDNDLVKYLREVSETIFDVSGKIEESIFSKIKDEEKCSSSTSSTLPTSSKPVVTKESIANRMKELLK